jgi:hypothetical protein
MAVSAPQFTPDLAAAQAARTLALQTIEERGRGAVLVGVARVGAALERLLQAVLITSPPRMMPCFRLIGPWDPSGPRSAWRTALA